MKRGKSIKGYLSKSFSLAVGITFIIIFVVTFMMVQSIVVALKSNSIANNLVDSASNLTEHIDGMYNMAKAIAADKDVYDSSKGFEEKKEKLVSYAETLGISSIGYITAEGYLTSTDGFENDISDRDYYINLMKGINYISNPSFNEATQKQIIFIGVPLYENGSTVGAITCTFDSSYLSEIINKINYMGNGEAYMLSDTGTVVASYNMDDVINKYNVIEAAKEDSSLQKNADFTQKLLDEDSGNSKYDGKIYFYDKVEDSNGWTIVFRLDEKVFSQEITKLIILFVAFGIAGIAIVVVISLMIGNKLGKRLDALKNDIEIIASGDFTVAIDANEMKKTDEVGRISVALSETIEAIREILLSVKAVSDSLSNQVTILENASNTLTIGTENVESSLGEMQTGNTNQSEEINSINERMEEFSVNIDTVSRNIEDVVTRTSEATKELETGSVDIKNLKESFSSFNSDFEGFQEIIKTMNDSLSSITMITTSISDIASQTNLLSLNASIEAARAGESGKGFAVVAQEIGQLAEQSAESATKISDVVKMIVDSGNQLIESTSDMDAQIQNQMGVINTTLKSFENLSAEMNDMLPRMQEIAELSNETRSTSVAIGDSLQSANAISEELVATTVEVGNTSNGFADSSRKMELVSAKIMELTNELSDKTKKFQV